MSAGEAVVITVRLAVPLLILRNALLGGLAAMLVDALDVVMVSFMHIGGFGAHYAPLDKGLDTYYLTLELWVALGWASAYAPLPAAGLYVYRLVGVVSFELSGWRPLLLMFPNLFENWWLYCVVVARFFPRLYPQSLRSVAWPLLLLLVPKLGQEYMLHYAEFQPWDWIKRNVIRTS